MLKRHPWVARLMLLSALTLAACGGPAATATPAAAAVQVDLVTRPEPPASGEMELVISVVDAAGQPVDTAEVNVIASHQDMSGMDMSGAATPQGDGRYAITADFGMAGNWLVTVEVRGVSAEVIRENFELDVR